MADTTTTTMREAPTVLLRRGLFGSDTAFTGDPADGMTLLEAVAYTAGERHSNKPACVCPVLAGFGNAWNDGMRDSERNELLRYIPKLAGTCDTRMVETQRVEMALWWLIREHAPVWLDAAGLTDDAEALRTMRTLDQRTLRNTNAAAWDCLTGGDTTRTVVVNATRDTADDYVADAVRHAGGYAAWTVVREATASPHHGELPLWGAARVAWKTALHAATAVTEAADWGGNTPDFNWATLRDAVIQDTLEPTIQKLQASAHRLFNDMIDLTKDRP